VLAVLIWRPWRTEGQRTVDGKGGSTVAAAGTTASATPVTNALPADVALVVSGYIITRERIEISPRFMGLVKWIGVRKGDAVTNGQIVVRLDDAEPAARLREAEGRLANLRAALAKAEVDLARVGQLAQRDIESQQAVDDARWSGAPSARRLTVWCWRSSWTRTNSSPRRASAARAARAPRSSPWPTPRTCRWRLI
jgi:multidrug efflux pump subunit AcrA (membrane-fusion protein)